MRRKAPVNSNCKNCTFFKNAIISINYGMIGKKKLFGIPNFSNAASVSWIYSQGKSSTMYVNILGFTLTPRC